MKEIIKLLKYYCENDKLVDHDFYDRLFQIYKELIPYKLDDIIYVNKDSKSKYNEGLEGMFGRAGYDYLDNVLVIYEDNLKIFALKEMPDDISNHDKIVFYNVNVLQTIMHEYEHVYQEYKIKKGEDEESKLFKFLSSDRNESSDTYNYSLFERLAEYNSLNSILEILKHLNFESNLIYDYYNELLRELKLSGYEYLKDGYYASREDGEFSSPTIRYVETKKYDKEIFNKLIVFINTEELREMYGLLSENEYENKINNKIK